ncbi:MAG TPA: hypothetical protein VFV73_21840 [Streptosporangiaceae bacterium]|nr:hypothetical protein [Streptosporangiaceae bacterium]
MSDSRDELAAADVISSGGEDFSAFAVSRWPGLVRLAFGLTGDRWTAEDLAQATLAPVDSIIRRGRARRRRRAGAVAGGLGLAGIIAAAALLTPPRGPAPHEPPFAVTVPASGIAGPGGVFASGTASGHAWRLAVENIADPGYRCLPAITVNGTDANLAQPNPRNYAAVAFGPAAPGLGFAYVQLPADVTGIVLDGRESIPAVTATACGLRYRLAGFAYRLAHPPQVTAAGAAASYQLPSVGSLGTTTAPAGQSYGVWTNVGTPGAETEQGTLASGRDWSISVLLDAGGDCYSYKSMATPGAPQIGACGPASTPDGTETIMALSLSYPPAHHRPAPVRLHAVPALSPRRSAWPGVNSGRHAGPASPRRTPAPLQCHGD